MKQQLTMEEWKREIAEARAKDRATGAVKEKRSVRQQLAEAKVKADEINAARKKPATDEPAGEHIINILED